jgi:hypothetical protein
MAHDEVDPNTDARKGQMRTRRHAQVTLAAVATAMTLAGTAAGFAVGRVFHVRAGESANISVRSGIWTCRNVNGQYVTCQGGDAFPYVELGGSGRAWPCNCVTVKVFTLRDPQGGHVVRTYENGYPVYIFRAL